MLKSTWFCLAVMILASLSLTGCGKNLTTPGELVDVQGEVFLDGQPVAGARVLFVPENPEVGQEFVVSWGETNVRGEFELSTRDDRNGAMIGKHRVYISLADFSVPRIGSADGAEDQQSNGQASTPIARSGFLFSPPNELAAGEKIPFYYNRHSELNWTVVPGGGIHRVKLELSSTDPLLER